MVASTIGTAIEWYDFCLYGTAAALVFPALFFPGSFLGARRWPEHWRHSGHISSGSPRRVFLVVPRVVQGIGVDGEWAGSVLLLSTGMVKLMSATTGTSVVTWGWRIPFLASAVLVVIGSSTYISWYLSGCAVLSMTALVLMPRPPRSSEPQRAPAATPAANDPLYCRRVGQQRC